MTPQERNELDTLIDAVETAYASAIALPNGAYDKSQWAAQEENIRAFVKRLLAAKDAELAAARNNRDYWHGKYNDLREYGSLK